MGTLHPMHIRDCQLRPWKHKIQEIEIDIEFDEKQLQKQIEKKADETLNRVIKRINSGK